MSFNGLRNTVQGRPGALWDRDEVEVVEEASRASSWCSSAAARQSA